MNEAARSLIHRIAAVVLLGVGVGHFYFVLFHPPVYPMSLTWLTGEMSRSEAEHHHGDWLRRLEAKPRRKKPTET